jgi:hypothetical protein
MKRMEQKHSWLLALSVVFFLMAGVTSLAGATNEIIYATYVNGFGANNGWNNVNKAEGYLGASEYSLYDYAWKDLDVNPYHLLKAYTFDSWTQDNTITNVRAFVEVEARNTFGLHDEIDVQFRVHNGTEVIKSKRVTIDITVGPTPSPTVVEVLLPVPPGGWTKEKVDALDLWIGSKEWAEANLYVYYFGIKIVY